MEISATSQGRMTERSGMKVWVTSQSKNLGLAKCLTEEKGNIECRLVNSKKALDINCGLCEDCSSYIYFLYCLLLYVCACVL